MEPKLPEVNLGPERTPAHDGQNADRNPVHSSPEVGFDSGADQFEQRGETGGAVAVPILPPPLVAPSPPEPTAVTSSPAPVVDDMPLVAADEDLIEKEWVDKAKQIILQTKDDPFRREQEVNKLQADYLRKRYGRELGDSQ